MYKSHNHCQQKGHGIRMSVAAVVAFGAALAAPVSGQEAAAPASLEEYRMRGLQAAMETKGALGGELMKAMESGGPENAVAFCNTRALPITEDMSERLGMDVSRVSDQPRNPANQADAAELAVIAEFKAALASGRQPAPAVREHGDAVIGYYPIVTNAMCLKCHGSEGVDISPATLSVIDSKYPDDQATGYGEKELRGLFVVKMDRPQDASSVTGPGSN